MKPVFQVVFFISLLLVFLKVLLTLMPGQPIDFVNVQQHMLYTDFTEKGYFDFLIQMWSGNFGYSFLDPQIQVQDLVLRAFSQTLRLALPALVIIFFKSLFLAAFATLYKKTWVESFVDGYFNFFLSMPILLFAPMLVYIFIIRLDLFPLVFLGEIRSYILPVVALCVRPVARFGIILKEKLIAESDKPYVVVLIAKGLGPFQILFQHLLRSTLMLWTRSVGFIAIGVFSGSFLVENLFSIPGVGRLFVESLLSRDYPVVTAVVFILGFGFITVNILLDTFQEKHEALFKN